MPNSLNFNSMEQSSSLNQGTVGSPFKTPHMTNQATVVSAPRYLIVKRNEGDFSKVSPFLISKLFYGLVGQTKEIRKIKDGLLIETSSAKQSERLVSLTKLGDMQVTVTPHSTLNFSKGIIFCRDLLNCGVTEILEGLKSEGVIDVKRLSTKREGMIIESPAHILTFNSPKLPNTVKVAFYSLKVRPYIPPPLRCFKCQKFGHTSMRCTSDVNVCICGEPVHEGTGCNTPITCVNCSGSHFANAKGCMKYKEEVAIQTIKVTEKISYFEAKRKVISSVPQQLHSYSQVLAKPVASVNTQDIVRQLIPEIKKLIEDLLSQRADMETDSTSHRSQIETKRKRNMGSTNDETDTDDNQPVSFSDSSKKKGKGSIPKKSSKRGRPKNRQPP